ncbi:nucleolin [Plecturocebus cupreus]
MWAAPRGSRSLQKDWCLVVGNGGIGLVGGQAVHGMRPPRPGKSTSGAPQRWLCRVLFAPCFRHVVAYQWRRSCHTSEERQEGCCNPTKESGSFPNKKACSCHTTAESSCHSGKKAAATPVKKTVTPVKVVATPGKKGATPGKALGANPGKKSAAIPAKGAKNGKNAKKEDSDEEDEEDSEEEDDDEDEDEDEFEPTVAKAAVAAPASEHEDDEDDEDEEDDSEEEAVETMPAKGKKAAKAVPVKSKSVAEDEVEEEDDEDKDVDEDDEDEDDDDEDDDDEDDKRRKKMRKSLSKKHLENERRKWPNRNDAFAKNELAVVDVRIGMTKKFGYVDFGSAEDLEKALELTGLKGFGNEIKLEKSKGKDRKSEMIVTDWETGSSKGFSFVNFNSEEDAKAAKEAIEDGEIDGNKVTLDCAKPKGEGGFRGLGGGRGGFGG